MTLPADRENAAAAPARKPVVNISIIKPKPGKFDEFMALQLAQHQRLRGKVEGLVGGRLFRSADRSTAILVSVFETEEAAWRFREDERFIAHLIEVRPLIESAQPGAYETAYEVGTI